MPFTYADEVLGFQREDEKPTIRRPGPETALDDPLFMDRDYSRVQNSLVAAIQRRADDLVEEILGFSAEQVREQAKVYRPATSEEKFHRLAGVFAESVAAELPTARVVKKAAQGLDWFAPETVRESRELAHRHATGDRRVVRKGAWLDEFDEQGVWIKGVMVL